MRTKQLLLFSVAILSMVSFLLSTGCASQKHTTRTNAVTTTTEETTKRTISTTFSTAQTTTTSEQTHLPSVRPKGTTVALTKETVAVPVKKKQAVPTSGKKDNHLKLLNVPYINQLQKYPTGCESVSTVMALQYAGYAISPETFIDKYLPQGRKPFKDENGNYFGDDPRKCFLGSPYLQNGWGCYEPVIEKSVNAVISHSRNRCANLSGMSMQQLCSQYISKDIPVIMWATMAMAPASPGKTWNFLDVDGTFTWIYPNHCLLLVGFDDSHYYFNDPLESKDYGYSRSVVEARYASLGKQALAIVPYTPSTTTTSSTTASTSVPSTRETTTISKSQISSNPFSTSLSKTTESTSISFPPTESTSGSTSCETTATVSSDNKTEITHSLSEGE